MNLKPLGLLVLLLSVAATANAGLGLLDKDEDPDAPKWAEDALELPAFPQEASLIEFYVSAATPHKYYIDAASLSVGKDGVVRYGLVVRTRGGATNTSFEGIRCESREVKVYATGRPDGAWSLARRSEWRPILNMPTNRHHAALSRDYFCPVGNVIYTAEEGREALRLGKHPNAK